MVHLLANSTGARIGNLYNAIAYGEAASSSLCQQTSTCFLVHLCQLSGSALVKQPALHMHTVRLHSQTVLRGNNTTPAVVMVPLCIMGGIQLAVALLLGRYPSGYSVVCDSVLLRSCLFHVCVARLLTVTASTFLEQTW